MTTGIRGVVRFAALLLVPLGFGIAFRGAPGPARHVVEIRGMAFHPETLQAARGDTIVWINRDIVPHTATGAGPVQWTTDTLTQGEEGRYVPDRKGEAPYVCALHPTMRGMLIIR